MDTAIIQALIISVLAPTILLILNRVFNKKQNDTDLVAKLQKMYNDAIDALAEERMSNAKIQNDLMKEIADLKERQRNVEQATFGPFLITLEVDSRPLQITSSKIELAPVKK